MSDTTLSRLDLVSLLRTVSRPLTVELIYKSTPPFLVSGERLFPDVFTLQRFECKINWKWQDLFDHVKADRGIEIPESSGERRWGTRLFNCPLVEYKGKFYLSAADVKSPSEFPTYHKTNGDLIQRNELVPYFKRETVRDEGFQVKDFKIDGIQMLTMDHVYRIVD